MLKYLLGLVIFSCFSFSQNLQVSCPSPGTTATVTWADTIHPVVDVRTEKNPNNSLVIADYETGFTQLGMITVPGVTIQTATVKGLTPGPWLVYLAQIVPYWQSDGFAFNCDAPITPSAVGNFVIGSGLTTTGDVVGNIVLGVDWTTIPMLVPPPTAPGKCVPVLGSSQEAVDEQFYYRCIPDGSGGYRWGRVPLAVVW